MDAHIHPLAGVPSNASHCIINLDTAAVLLITDVAMYNQAGGGVGALNGP